MSKQDVAAVALRLMGVGLLLWCVLLIAVSVFSSTISLVTSEGASWQEFLTVGFGVALSGALLLAVSGATFSSERLARRLFPDQESEDEASRPASATDIYIVAFSLLGAFLVITGLVRVITHLGSIVTLMRAFPGTPERAQDGIAYQMTQISGRLLQVGLGAYFFVCSEKVAAVWQRLQRPKGAAHEQE